MSTETTNTSVVIKSLISSIGIFFEIRVTSNDSLSHKINMHKKIEM